ncbi:hypothetical protein FOXG_22528 [Fusarium oxysporum f. sp. lycopersici 4287]|uniref:Uncharacterized protein n=1 Tax=Fusarium oxysporum f. sp. lycopersici (strain 4287 / CBS 123668 / FGSC 9935 / NRRL 34936) TaxID=426428 RepID=A0A0J9WA08_FUSO4|nr:hypothetical protein FOXG_22528 [Fusarium oxysporum f. sp. lycopersici 4287]KAJ0131474.1 Uncharacterized protein HZ326_25436 [Fusarium oxysporum f. sp. albedinis]KNB19331.1 hypothetical protein FOXG_22528 [Fusarium oxysporum f. sp. lycopersici 4287]
MINLEVVLIRGLSLNSHSHAMLIKFVVVRIEFVDKIGAGKAFNAIIVAFFSSAHRDAILWFCDLVQ